ncbi:hypothetical protein HPB51_013806 [Rhipicephalus microplus]|uniref:CCHC-type domain-containing protein n=1 Tax=Rhipicephalus microplus TaxID=6941 RepID=A0A9J6F2Y7_RHIMP|nr:hypothetical protein HPB51_013806 [Rhipicephalus microplus]
MLNGSAQRLPRKPRQPRLPDDHVKVVIRPRDGLNLSKGGEAQLCDAFLREVDLHATLLKEDIYRTYVEANLIVVSAPQLFNAEIYSRISKLQVETETYDVRAYVTSPENTAKGVIYNIPPYDSPEDISASLVNDRNPTILQARRMGKTNTVLIVFDGAQVPFHVYYRGAEFKCYLHKKCNEVCDKGGAVGHRSDVCPKPNAVICTLCGTANPATAHPCTLKCHLCGQAHQTGDKTSPRRYQTPRLLIYRRQEKAKLQQQQYLSTMISTQDSHPERQEVKPSDTRSRSTSPISKRRGSRSRSKQRRKNQPQELQLGSAAPEALNGPPLQQRQPSLTLATPTSFDELRRQRSIARQSVPSPDSISAVALANGNVHQGTLSNQIKDFIREEVARQLSLLPHSDAPTTSLPSNMQQAIRTEIFNALPTVPASYPCTSMPSDLSTAGYAPTAPPSPLSYAAVVARPPPHRVALSAPPPPASPPVYRPPPRIFRPSNEWRTRDNRPICFACGIAGHIARFCRRRPTPVHAYFAAPTYAPQQTTTSAYEQRHSDSDRHPSTARFPSPRRRSPSPMRRRPPL